MYFFFVIELYWKPHVKCGLWFLLTIIYYTAFYNLLVQGRWTDYVPKTTITTRKYVVLLTTQRIFCLFPWTTILQKAVYLGWDWKHTCNFLIPCTLCFNVNILMLPSNVPGYFMVDKEKNTIITFHFTHIFRKTYIDNKLTWASQLQSLTYSLS